MTWRPDVTTSHKWIINDTIELSDSKKTWKPKKRIIFSVQLQDKICIVNFVTSWRHVDTLWRQMTLQFDYHDISNIIEISTIN